MLTRLEEIINQITKDTGIPQKDLVEKLESFLKSLQKFPKLPEHPKTLIEQLADDQESNRRAIRIYNSSLIETLRKFVNMLAYHWKTAQSTNQSPETITNIRQAILEELNNFLTYFEKEHTHLVHHIAEFKKIIVQEEIIKKSTQEIRQIIGAIEQIIKTEPLNLESLSLKVEYLCEYIDVIGKLGEETKEKVPIPLGEINDNCLEPIRKILSKLDKTSAEKCIRLLLKINDRLLKYFSSKDSKKLMNLFDRIEYLRLPESLWDEFKFKDCVKEAYELGEKIYTNIDSYREYFNQGNREAFLGKFGEICRNMSEFEVCEPAEKMNLYLKSNGLLQKSLIRDGEPVLKYFGRNYPRIGRNYMDLRQWEDAIRCFMNIKDIDPTKKVDKKIAFEARVNIADCYLKLGLEARKYDDIEGASQCFKLAEEFYKKAEELPKLSLEDGRHLTGKTTDFYYRSQQYEKALPLYREIMQRGSISPSDEKNLYDCFSYRWGECLYQIGEIDKAIEQFKTTLWRKPIGEHRIKSYAWLMKLYSIIRNWDKLSEIKEQILRDKEIQGAPIQGISTDKLEVLLMPAKMEEYIAQISNRLARGDHWAVIDELKEMINLHKLFEGHDDTVLLTKIAQADTRAGDYESALKTLYYVKGLDERPKNQAQALSYIGRVYMEQGKYKEAINAFQESFELGGDIGMLLLQAAAYRKLKEYDLSIGKYKEILQSGKDKRPNITKTGLAKTYWGKYQHEGKQEDIENALSHIVDVIKEYSDDRQACDVLVRMSNNSVAIRHIADFIEKGHNLAAKGLLKRMTLHNMFPNEVISACLRGLSSRDTTTPDYWEFALSSADFLMEATIYSYYFGKEDSFDKLIEDIVSGILNLENSKHILREYLCASKGSYADFLEEVYARQIEKILEPLANKQTDLQGILSAEILPRINQFIQSEIPEDFGVFLNNYKGREPEGVSIKDELFKKFYGTTDLEKEGKYILSFASEITSDIMVPYPAWLLFEKLVIWFYLYPYKGLWHEILSLANKWTIEVKPIVDDRHIKVCFSARAFTNEVSEEFKQSFENIQSEHNSCPIPKMHWFKYAFSEELIEGQEAGCNLSLTIEMPHSLPLPDYLQNLNVFLEHMMSSFKEGVSGSFKPDEYRKRAKELFPDDINTLNKEMGADFIHIYIDWHFSLLFNSAVKGDDYRRAIHDCVKGPLQLLKQAGLNTEDEILEFLSGLERLPWELGRFRRRTLGTITGRSSLRKLDLEGIIKDLIDDLSAVNDEIIFDTKTSPCELIYGVEPLLKRAFFNLLNNAVWAVRSLSGGNKKIAIFIFEENNNVNLLIENSFEETIPSAPFSSRMGLKSARYIVEKEHGGTLTTNRDSARGIFITKVSLPIDFRYGKEEM